MRQLEEMHRRTKKQRGKYSLIAAFIHICIIYILPEKKMYASNALPCSKNVKHARLENDLNWTKSKTYTLRTQCGFSNHTMLACLKIEIILCPLVLWGPTFTGSQCICTLFEHLPQLVLWYRKRTQHHFNKQSTSWFDQIWNPFGRQNIHIQKMCVQIRMCVQRVVHSDALCATFALCLGLKLPAKSHHCTIWH